MKITKFLLSLVIAGSCLNQASAQTRHIGDDSPYSAVSAQPVRTVSNSQAYDMSMIAPSSYEMGSYDMGSCNTGCSSGGCASGGSDRFWLNMESLLWFGQRRSTPALLTTSATGVLPVAGEPGVTTVVGGGDGLESGLLPGYRLSGGRYFGSCQKIGIGGRAYGIFQSEQTSTLSSAGGATDPSIGIPFFNTQARVEDAYLVAFNDGAGTPVSAGTASVRSDLNMIGADGSLYLLLGRSHDHRVDLMGGYTYNKLKDSVSITSRTTDLLTGNLIPDGTTFDTNDLFATSNIFNGGHLGVLSSVVRGRVSLSTMAKVALGNVRQTVDARGFTVQGGTSPSGAFPGGVLTQQSNINSTTRDRFTFLPEMNVKLGYAINNNWRLTCGYSFLYWSSVAMAGNQIDPNVDFRQARGGAAGIRPAPLFKESGYWMHGVDVGLTTSF